MKKTIEILADGNHVLPIGTKLRQFNNGAICNEIDIQIDGYAVCNVNNTSIINEVDFSNTPPLFPTRGMIVPEEGMPFADGNGKLLEVGKYGLVFQTVGDVTFDMWGGHHQTSRLFELTRTLPKTLKVCAECFKEACECKHEEGWYRIRYRTGKCDLVYWDGDCFKTHSSSTGGMHIVGDVDIDWENPINVIHEEESLGGSVSINLNSVRSCMVQSMRDLVRKLNKSFCNDKSKLEPYQISEEIDDLSNNIGVLASAYIDGDDNFKDLTDKVQDIPKLHEE